MKKFFLLLFSLGLFANAQTQKLLLASGEVNLQPNSNTYTKSDFVNKTFNGKFYKYITFNELPSEDQKSALKENGISLLEYLPNNTFIASFTLNKNYNCLKNMPVYGIYNIQPAYKMQKELYVALKEKNYPHYAYKNGRVGIIFRYYNNLNHTEVQNWLTKNKYKIAKSDAKTKSFTIWIKPSKVNSFLDLPFISGAELEDEAPQTENNVGRTSHRSNAISTDYAGGRKYNGFGSKVMIQDDGIIGPHIDYQGRIGAQFLTSNSGQHGDHCSGILMGGGNLNPLRKGMAWGSTLYVYNANTYQGFDSINSHYSSLGIRVISTSYGDGCNAGYTSFAKFLDDQINATPEVLIVFSAGNSGTSNCNYGAGAGWGNVTGGHKHSKNSIAVANLDYLDVVASSSSRGPAHDGRLKPEISAVGTNVLSTNSTNTYQSSSGTSMACPAIAGVAAQLQQAYRNLNNGNNPPSALLKAILMNTADDLGNAGPDYTYGYGRVNGLNAAKTIEAANYFNSTISNGQTQTFTVSIAPNTAQYKILTCWNDPSAAISTSLALVNNLNTKILTPSGATINPLVLNSTPTASLLSAAATQTIDNLNNHEQITLTNPVAGVYTLVVNGANVPVGPQQFFTTYIAQTNEFVVTYPIGGEGFVPGETETIRWNSLVTSGTQTLEYSTNAGTSWTTISSAINATQRYFNWTVPTTVSGNCKVRIKRGALSASSDTTFSIIQLPTGINVVWSCADSLMLSWGNVSTATAYDVFKLGTMYMDSVGTTNTNSFVVSGTGIGNQTNWFSVRSRGALNAIGRRANAVQKTPGTFSCTPIIITGIVNQNPTTSILIYPNPSQGFYTVDLGNNTNNNVEYGIFDVSGKISQSNNFKETGNTINISDFNSGIYFLKITTDDGMYLSKLIKL